MLITLINIFCVLFTEKGGSTTNQGVIREREEMAFLPVCAADPAAFPVLHPKGVEIGKKKKEKKKNSKNGGGARE